MYRLGMIIFGSVRFLSNKSNQTEKKIKKKTETGSNRSVSVRFFREKIGSNWFDSVFPVWLGFGSVFSFFGLARFFRFGSVFFLVFFSVWVWFGSVQFFRFFAYKIETEPNR